jgi:hypothetical protein
MNWNRSQPIENPEPGSHIARCFAIIDLGTQQHSFNGEVWSSRDVRISFELPNEKMQGTYNADVKGKPFASSVTLKQSLHPSSKMRKLLKSWRGRDFTKEEVNAFAPKKLLGVPCRLTLVASQDGQYVNIDSIAPLGKGEKCPKQVNPSVYFSLDPNEFNFEVFTTLGEKMREKIAGSPEFKALEDGGGSDEPDPEQTAESADAAMEAEDDVPW